LRTPFARANTASSLDADRSTATLTLFLVAFWALALVARPYNAWRVGLLAVLAGCFVLTVAVPWLRDVTRLSYGDLGNDGIGLACALVGALTLSFTLRLQGHASVAVPTHPA
jgi:cation-transporting ATPase E